MPSFSIAVGGGSTLTQSTTHPTPIDFDRVDALWLVLRAVLAISGTTVTIEAAGGGAVEVTTTAGTATITTSDPALQYRFSELCRREL